MEGLAKRKEEKKKKKKKNKLGAASYWLSHLGFAFIVA